MLATLLATPCSAPFVGTAVSFALSQSDAVYGIMFMMGVGLALPWLVFVSSRTSSLTCRVRVNGWCV